MQPLPLYLLAFLSGFAALVYQVAWSRMLSLTFGSTTLALSCVVGSFMCGMGLGAWLYHRVGDHFAVSLRAYGLLEIGIAVSTACFTLLFIPLPHAFAALATVFSQGPAMDLLGVAMIFGLLVVPSALMGATYPALCESLICSPEEVGTRLGWIYGLNTVGAAMGALAAGFVMIEILGSHGSVTAANAINLAVGTFALLLARRHASALKARASHADESLSSEHPYWLTGLVLVGSGFATLGYEIVWFRALHYIMGNGTYVLSTALVIFLLGLGFGGMLYRSALRIGRPERILGLTQLGIAILALLAIGAEQWLLVHPEINSRISAFSSSAVHQSWQSRMGLGFAVSLMIMLPPTLLMGLAFPIASRLFLSSIDSLSSRVGLAYLLSNLGSIVGAIFAAMWILPELGTVKGTELLAGVNVGLGVLVLARVSSRAVRLASVGAVALVVSLGILLPSRLAFQVQIPRSRQGIVQLVFERESDMGTVQVYGFRNRLDSVAMSIDGTVIANTEAWDPMLYVKQKVIAHLPMSLDRSIRHTLSLGIASGSTVSTLSQYDWIETIDAVEINDAVIKARRFFFESRVFSDPRTTIFIEDAMHYLLRTNRQYDLIVSDAKQNVKFAGNAKILSKELYEYSLARLSPCGLFAQSLPILNVTRESLRLTLRTFLSTFPEVEFFIDSPFYIIAVGSRCPIGGRERPTREDLERSGTAREIREMFVPDPTALDALWFASGDELASFIGDGPLNSWDRLPLEFWSYRAPRPHSNEAIETLDALLAPRERDPLGNTPFSQRTYFAPLLEIQRAYLSWMHHREGEAMQRVDRVLREYPDLALAKRAKNTVGVRMPEW
jgi:spermidine synthase